MTKSEEKISGTYGPLADMQRHSISFRIVTVSLLALAIALAMIGGTLWLSWQLEGGAAAINDAGSLRMRSYRLALSMQIQPLDAKRIDSEIQSLEKTLYSLHRGDPARPLVLPSELGIRKQYGLVLRLWDEHLRPLAEHAAKGDSHAAAAFGEQVNAFVAQIDILVSAVEHDNAHKTGLLRLSQAVLIAIAIIGTVAMIYLQYLWIIRPVASLQAGIANLATRRFDVRIPVETDDEFGELAQGFNAMAEELQTLYRGLEQRVRDKTAQLEAQNRELAILYEMAAFLSHPSSVEAQCRGFLQRILARFHADGGSLRILDQGDQQLNLVVSENLAPEVLQSEQCRKAHDCLCGESTRTGVAVLRDLRNTPRHRILPCNEAGFSQIAAFRIASPQAALGSFTLHFQQAYPISAAEMKLLETLGQQFGTALENTRLMKHERLLAVSEERNLVAQGLHDSLAQSLNFLNLQVQMLEKALVRTPHGEAEKILPLLRTGVQESYNDVRELLANFRTRLENLNIKQVLQAATRRFYEQSGIEVEFEYSGEGPTLSDEQKLQLLFILQEALSNIRKHAQTHSAQVLVRNDSDFYMEISDQGVGFDAAPLPQQSNAARQVGLHIMQERADRIGCQLTIASTRGVGTRIAVLLRAASRQTA
ncbi:type IV pili methyl-accepting chemotaxis transducer N-terminal domain-containing protein [Uliginosibacterium gangwonense]|uniref:type IV pili methyl-accepting chemotaxis transducer N-terminal domain-containing protein n=1 Tax=Uliginosibacterium gangwonense TaxID=392736 RepID=UPI0003A6075A|nr:type IV pili methyl-accepting chemotaxis transducer N-terminal domain-containing protein [Uliginosibacterium gangwonense]